MNSTRAHYVVRCPAHGIVLDVETTWGDAMDAAFAHSAHGQVSITRVAPEKRRRVVRLELDFSAVTQHEENGIMELIHDVCEDNGVAYEEATT